MFACASFVLDPSTSLAASQRSGMADPEGADEPAWHPATFVAEGPTTYEECYSSIEWLVHRQAQHE
eukprot:12926741-Prorocentrum_lima.AAC.1